MDTVPVTRFKGWDVSSTQGTPLVYLGEDPESQQVLAARLSLPHQAFVLGRPRLRALIERAQAGGLVSVVAGPGSGKTAFLIDLLSSAECDTVYLALDHTDQDPLRFLGRLMAGLGVAGAPVAEGQQQGSEEAVSDDETRSAVVEAVSHLVEFMSEREDTRTLVALDDVHLADGSTETLGALELIIRALPPGWTLITSSRRPVPLTLQPVDLGGRFIDIPGRALRMTPKELAAWAGKNWNLSLEPSKARTIWRLTEGWPAALALLGPHLVSGDHTARRKDVVTVVSRGQDLRAYLKANILSEMESYKAEVITVAALLPQVVFPRDAELFPGSPQEAEEVLAELASHNALVTAAGRRRFTLHPLLCGYVEREVWGDDARNETVRAVAEHLCVHDPYHAVYLYLRIAAWDEAVEQLHRLAISSPPAITHFARDDWLRLVPDDVLRAQPWLMMVKARLLQNRAEFVSAGTHYERASQLFEGVDDGDGLLLAMLGSAFCLFKQGHRAGSRALLQRCRSYARSASEKVEVLVPEGHVLASLGLWDEAVENWEKALVLSPVSDGAFVEARVDHHRAQLFHALGHCKVAKQWADKALEGCSRQGALHHMGALDTAARVKCDLGEYDAADAHVTKCLALARSRKLVFVEASILLTQASVHLGRGEAREALPLMKEAHSIAEKADAAGLMFRAGCMLGDLCRRNRNPARALEHHREALALVGAGRLSDIQRLQVNSAMGMDMVAMGEAGEAQMLFDTTVARSRRIGVVTPLITSLFYQGWVYACAGREHEALCALKESMRLAEQHRFVQFFSLEAQHAVPIMALCDRYGVGGFLRDVIVPGLPRRLRNYYLDLAHGSTYPTDVPLGPVGKGQRTRGFVTSVVDENVAPEAVEGIESLTEREREVLKLIALGMPNKTIASMLFITEKTVKTHANRIFRKLGVDSRVQATLVLQSYHRAKRTGPGLPGD